MLYYNYTIINYICLRVDAVYLVYLQSYEAVFLDTWLSQYT
jgi:hypothetical protein